MKITELKCTACKGTLKIENNNQNIVVCEYCGSKYAIERESSGDVNLRLDTQNIWYTPKAEESRRGVEKTGWELYGWKRNTLLVMLIVVIVAVVSWNGINNSIKTDKAEKSVIPMGERTESGEAEQIRGIPFSGVLAIMAENVFGKQADLITEEELTRFQWLELRQGIEEYQLGYSFENPYESENAVLTWMSIPKGEIEEELEQLTKFKGLKKLYIDNYLTAGQLKGLNLQGIGCYFNSPADLFSLVEKPDGLIEVTADIGMESLEGVNQFINLERLTLDVSGLTDLKELVNLKNLKALTLENADAITDYSVLSVMPWLEELSVASEGLKDISFVSGMEKLHSLSLFDTKVLTLDKLEGKTSLTSLTIDGCDELKNCSSISGLSNLQQLKFELPYNCPEPDLSTLIQLKSLEISGVESVAFLKNLSNLEKLSLKNCSFDEASAFAGLVQLKELICSGIYINVSGWGFVENIPALESLNLTGVSSFYDMSGLFNIPTLKALILNGVECEINFSNLQNNQSLRTLELDGVKLYKNVQVSGGGGITYVDYDDVTLDEHTDFLINYPNLEHLSLVDNKLTQIGFASNLPALKSIDIAGNYITDLKPLSQISALQLVNCVDNPVENYRVLNEGVYIIK